MAMFDIFDLLSFLDVITWRILTSTAIGLGVGAAVFYLSGESTATAPVAVGLGFFGFLIGLFWEFGRESGKRRRRRR